MKTTGKWLAGAGFAVAVAVLAAPLTTEKLRGRVVAVEFWTFG